MHLRRRGLRSTRTSPAHGEWIAACDCRCAGDQKHWAKWPKAKIGVVLGTKSGVLALVTEGAAGKKTLRDLEEKTE